MRRATALVVAAGLLAVALTGCSSNPNADCGDALKAGPASDLISATGKLGEKPTFDLPTPIDTTTSQRTIVSEGTGEQVHKGQLLEVQYTILDGENGEVQQQSSYKAGDTFPLAVGGGNAALSKGLQCVPVGSRVAIVLSPKDAGGSGASTSGIIVIDVLKAYLPAANGAVRPSANGFPTVVLAPTGQPGVTIPSQSGAPKEVRSEVLKAGSGATVKKDSEVVLHYTAVGWDQKNVVTSTWQQGTPDIVTIDTGASQLNQALPQEILKPLVGEKVGSQVVIEAPENGNVPAAAWVVDILGVR
ncbi:peptidylprolyl isomerase [Leifsonia sp. F6_8S_P_1B]|uniref:Peptidylprolyl isomerase n=1 Tax=Leifsonia williamsii TaxID=3035919 RepID=A0ABT8KG75_9MICO|nr:peptidylprolyl isomerase [Leifsonia williamsii]MDN4615344.1 peptidylprolyl isomerase [Leifsonia williamsii]